MVDKEIQELAQKVYNYLQPFCISIYLGGSYCQPFIKNPHDIDFICFSKEPREMCDIKRSLYFFLKKNKVDKKYDFIQIRNAAKEEQSYGSYINKEMIHLVGEKLNFNFDIINKDRKKYVSILLDTIDKLNNNIIKNKKRWYQVLRGYYILLNNSYDMTAEQIEILNKVHDQENGWEEYIKEVKEWLMYQTL